MLAELKKYARGLSEIASAVSLRGDNTSALVTANAHPWFCEGVRQGNVYALSTAAAGVTIAAANVFSASAAQPLVGVFNPPGSGVNVIVCRAKHTWNSGTAAAGGLVWGVAPSPAAVTAASGTNPTNVLTGQASGSAVRGYVNAALTGVTGMAIVGYAGGPSTGALAANSNQSFDDLTDGLIWIPPGAAGGLFAAAAGTSPIVNASMWWEEVPV